MENKKNEMQRNSELNIIEILTIFYKYKKSAISIIVIFFVIGIVYALSVTRWYEADVIIKSGHLPEYSVETNKKVFIAPPVDSVQELNFKFDKKKNLKMNEDSYLDLAFVPAYAEEIFELNVFGKTKELAIKKAQEVSDYIINKDLERLNGYLAKKENTLKYINEKIDEIKKTIELQTNEKDLINTKSNSQQELLAEYELQKQKLDTLLKSNDYENTKILAGISASEKPVKPNRTIIVLIFTVVGIILSIISVVTYEKIKTQK